MYYCDYAALLLSTYLNALRKLTSLAPTCTYNVDMTLTIYYNRTLSDISTNTYQQAPTCNSRQAFTSMIDTTTCTLLKCTFC